MFIDTTTFFLFLISLIHADCVCTPVLSDCANGYINTCGSLTPCDIINITTDNYELTQECVDSNIKVPYLEIYAGYFTLNKNFFNTSSGIHFKKSTGYIFWSGFNNFEQINEVTYVDTCHIVHKSPLSMTTGYFYFPSPVDFNTDSTFTLSGDAIFEFGGNTKGVQFISLDSATTTLKDQSVLNISTGFLLNPKEFILYNNSKLISAAVGRDKNGEFYFYDSSSLILEEGHYKISMQYIHYFYNNSILQVERDTKSYLKQVYFYDYSFLNISESSFIRFDSFSLSSTSFVEIGEDSVIQTPLSSLNGKIIFNNKARLNSKTSTSSLPSTLLLNVIETIIGYPIISLWNETSMLNDTNEIIYNGSECIDIYSFASSNDDLTLTSDYYYQLANNKLIRYCPSSVDYDVHCYLNTSIWDSSFIDSNGYPIFISPHCMNYNYSNYLCHSIQNTFEIGTDSINITFVEVLDTIIISEPSANQQIINGCFNIIETTFGLKIISVENTRSSTLKSENIEPNMFISIHTSTTINTINDEIQFDLTSLITNLSSTYSLNASIIQIIDDSIVTLDYSTPYIQFTNSNNYQFIVEFTQEEIGLYSENGFKMNDEDICYCLLFYIYYDNINSVVILVQSNSLTCSVIPLQKPCDEGYYESNNYTVCSECSMNNCKRCNETDCYLCSDNYYLENGNCIEKETTCEYAKSNECIKCLNGYFIEKGRCFNCGSNCISCSNSSICTICNSSLNIDENCISSIENVDILSNNNIISCTSNYYLNNSECIDCNSTYSHCKECTNTQCITCQDNFELTSYLECTPTHCNDIECTSCEDGYVLDQNGKCILEIENCLITINNNCIKCSNELYPSKQSCLDSINNCTIISTKNLCLRCLDGMYLDGMECKLCSSNCSTCINTEDTCLTCLSNKYIEDYECKTNDELNGTCSTLIASGSGCAICNDGYYRDELSCYGCMEDCSTCLTNDTCLTCTDDYFMSVSGKCLLQSTIIGCSVEISTTDGCTQCNDGYYNYNKICYLCNEECSTCSSSEVCTSCQNDYILVNYECIHYQLIDNCKKASDSKCSSCSFWHTLNSDQTGCDTQVVWWVIVLIVLFILIILIGVCVLIWYAIKLLFSYIQNKRNVNTTIFDMKTSNIQFKSTNSKDVVINKDEILFNDECDEIGVNEETRDLICVGNTSNHTIKVQFSVKDGCDKYEIRTNPQVISIRKGKACEFEIFIKPLCTCKINDQIMLISVDLSKGKTITTSITINTITIMTSRLDYSELIEDIKLGEGSFGIVNKGTFRGNQVAIKKMKQLNNKEQMEEFHKEVSMLDKFRNDYIVHFYGAVFIPTKICMVTEFAQYGSLQDLMKSHKETAPRYFIKMKILLDCSKGISYLHSNGILHRDIKPDNFLVLSLDTNVQVNAKLTDFGSSRNINLLMTNMTFTKGIGTPKYMAPEILDRKKYKKSADIYSFAITIYETMTWDDAYPKTKFQHPWSIANFVTNGERLPKPDDLSDLIYSLITNCWKQDQKKDLKLKMLLKNLKE